MALTTFTVNGVTVETTDASLVLAVLNAAQAPSPAVPAPPKAARERRATGKVAPKRVKPRKSAPKKAAEPKAAEPKAPKRKRQPKSVPTGTDDAAPTRSSTDEAMVEWKNRYTAKVNDLLAAGDGNEIAMAYAELKELVDALDDQATQDPAEAGRAIAKAVHLADLVNRLDEFDGAMAPVR